MNAVAFLLIAVAVSAIGGLYLWYKHRSPTTLDSGIKSFQREMDALKPPPGDDPDRRERRR